MAISDKTRKKMWARSGNRCAICQIELVPIDRDESGGLNIGEECHIISSKPTGPRYIKEYDNYDEYDNLILLCCNHHKEIDEQVILYPVDKLRRIKSEHETRIKDSIDNSNNLPSKNPPKLRAVDRISEIESKTLSARKKELLLTSDEGYNIAEEEFQRVLTLFKELVTEIKAKTPTWRIGIRENRSKGYDLLSYGYYMSIQHQEEYHRYLPGAYMFIGLWKGYFDSDGIADPFNKPENLDLIRVKFDINEMGQYGWVEVKSDLNFKSSEEITEIWFDKLIDYAMTNRDRY
jgi:hypothetical protein